MRDVLGTARPQPDPKLSGQTSLDLLVEDSETERSVTGEPRDKGKPHQSQQSAA